MKKIPKKDPHNLRYAIWIDGRSAQLIRQQPKGKKEFLIFRNDRTGQTRFDGEESDKTRLFGATISRQSHHQNQQNENLHKFVKNVANEVQYAHIVHILGSGDTRHLLQREIEDKKDLHHIILTNSACRKLDQTEFEAEANYLFEQENT